MFEDTEIKDSVPRECITVHFLANPQDCHEIDMCLPIFQIKIHLSTAIIATPTTRSIPQEIIKYQTERMSCERRMLLSPQTVCSIKHDFKIYPTLDNKRRQKMSSRAYEKLAFKNHFSVPFFSVENFSKAKDFCTNIKVH
ncbi:CLUMA_CG010762, isoform A [Clunio marinus]|uniref:CLUMA_CG010762, isoform A n=1 Tax=Clunio marinus TaxID=568069 RepID=A0A1J1IAY1_9DIPT|nr:CLUMA_CG010762, isoform A [Clunio marinus]